jgi:hypothetical protein
VREPRGGGWLGGGTSPFVSPIGSKLQAPDCLGKGSPHPPRVATTAVIPSLLGMGFVGLRRARAGKTDRPEVSVEVLREQIVLEDKNIDPGGVEASQGFVG